MGMDALFGPGIVRATVKSLGLTAARLDIHPQTHGLVLTVLQRGRPIHIDVPTGVTFTAEEICELFLGKAPLERSSLDGQKKSTIGQSDLPAKSFTHLNAVPMAVGSAPP